MPSLWKILTLRYRNVCVYRPQTHVETHACSGIEERGKLVHFCLIADTTKRDDEL
jgi:hypothetical protein